MPATSAFWVMSTLRMECRLTEVFYLKNKVKQEGFWLFNLGHSTKFSPVKKIKFSFMKCIKTRNSSLHAWRGRLRNCQNWENIVNGRTVSGFKTANGHGLNLVWKYLQKVKNGLGKVLWRSVDDFQWRASRSNFCMLTEDIYMYYIYQP